MLGQLGPDSHQVPVTKHNCRCDEWVHSMQSFCSILIMRNIFYRPVHATRAYITYALLLGVAFLSGESHAAEPIPTPSDKLASDLAGQTLMEKCSSADNPTQSLNGDATDIVAAQLLATIERTNAPELRGKLIGAYRRYLGCTANSGNSEEVGRP